MKTKYYDPEEVFLKNSDMTGADHTDLAQSFANARYQYSSLDQPLSGLADWGQFVSINQLTSDHFKNNAGAIKIFDHKDYSKSPRAPIMKNAVSSKLQGDKDGSSLGHSEPKVIRDALDQLISDYYHNNKEIQKPSSVVRSLEVNELEVLQNLTNNTSQYRDLLNHNKHVINLWTERAPCEQSNSYNIPGCSSFLNAILPKDSQVGYITKAPKYPKSNEIARLNKTASTTLANAYKQFLSLNPKKIENRDEKDIENDFYKLSLTDKVDNKSNSQSDNELAVKIIKTKQEQVNPIAADSFKLTKLKSELLEVGSNTSQIEHLSFSALININILFEKYDVGIENLKESIDNSDFIQILENLPESILKLIANTLFFEEVIEINSFVKMYQLYSDKFLEFLEKAYNADLEISEDLQFYVELYLNQVEMENVSLILNYADLDQVKILHEKSKKDFYGFISEIYEEDDLLEEREIIDLFELYIKVPQEDRWLLWEYLRGNSNQDKASTQRMDSYFYTDEDISTDLSDYESDNEYNINDSFVPLIGEE